MATSPIVAPVAQVSGPVALGKHSGTQLREGTNTPAGNPFMPRNNAVDGGRNSFETLERNVCSKDERCEGNWRHANDEKTGDFVLQNR